MSKDEWTEVSIENTETWDRQKTIEGKFIAHKESVGPNESKLYTLQTKDGNVGVWGSTVLDTKFEQISVGTYVRIEPLGEVKSEKTGRKYQDFRVSFKPDSVPKEEPLPKYEGEDVPMDEVPLDLI